MWKGASQQAWYVEFLCKSGCWAYKHVVMVERQWEHQSAVEVRKYEGTWFSLSMHTLLTQELPKWSVCVQLWKWSYTLSNPYSNTRTICYLHFEVWRWQAEQTGACLKMSGSEIQTRNFVANALYCWQLQFYSTFKINETTFNWRSVLKATYNNIKNPPLKQ